MFRRVSALLFSAAAFVATVTLTARADEPIPSGGVSRLRGVVQRASALMEPPNIVAPTMGGTQLWGDEIYYGSWRIQRNVVTGHYRLLDPDDVRRTWGTLDACRQRLDGYRRAGMIAAPTGTVIVVLHGLAGYRQQMTPLADYLAEHGRCAVINIAYPSTRAAVADHAAALRSIVANLEQANEIHFVAHSLGNLVVRHYLADYAANHQGRLDPRIRRMVMLGPPNHGSRAAEMLGGNVIFDNALGLSAAALGRKWRDLEPRLATPPFEFGIVAGGKGNDSGFNPLLTGDDDGTVSVAETQLAGASDFTLVDSLHSAMMTNPQVQEQTLRFLRTGAFHADGIRRPVAGN